jgi:hypothetical protein
MRHEDQQRVLHRRRHATDQRLELATAVLVALLVIRYGHEGAARFLNDWPRM